MTACHQRPSATTARDLMTVPLLVIPTRTSVAAAAGLLEAARARVAPVVDHRGRCVGLFGAADYRRWLDHDRTRNEVVTEWQSVPPAGTPDEVGHHMTRRVAVATPEADVGELAHHLSGAGAPYLVVLDRQRRPRGIVCARDVRAAEAAGAGGRRPAC
jgi:CBS-domain-containing membrane protein